MNGLLPRPYGFWISSATVTAGDNVTYTVTVSNNGPDTAEAVSVTDTLPSGVTFVSATPTQGSCSEAGGVVTCNLGSVANAANMPITINLSMTPDVTPDHPFFNPVCIDIMKQVRKAVKGH